MPEPRTGVSDELHREVIGLKHVAERTAVVRTVNELYEAGLITPTGGNVSLRLPDGAGFLITPSAMFKGALHPEDIVFLDPAGKPDPGGPAPSVETSMHVGIYTARRDVNAIIHAHPPMAILAGALEISIPVLVMEAVVLSKVPVIPFLMPGSEELARQVASALASAPVPAVHLQNHGVVTVGSSLREASNVALALEEVSHLAILAALTGRTPREIPEKFQGEVVNLIMRRRG